jgi:hypothetical protein
MAGPITNFNNLDLEVIKKIFAFLDDRELRPLTGVCKAWANFLLNVHGLVPRTNTLRCEESISYPPLRVGGFAPDNLQVERLWIFITSNVLPKTRLPGVAELLQLLPQQQTFQMPVRTINLVTVINMIAPVFPRLQQHQHDPRQP